MHYNVENAQFLAENAQLSAEVMNYWGTKIDESKTLETKNVIVVSSLYRPNLFNSSCFQAPCGWQ